MTSVAVVGGGIGGIAAALALDSRGLQVKVYEKSSTLREAGAGVGLSPNGLLPLYRLGLRKVLSEVGVVSTPEFRTWTGDLVSQGKPPAAAAISSSDISPLTFHRMELLQVLADALPVGILEYGHECIGVEHLPDAVKLYFAEGDSIAVDVVIGADGIHSVVQREVVETAPPTSEGIMAYRGLIPTERLSWPDASRTSMWIGPDRSFLCYPVSGGNVMNMVAFVPSTLDVTESWVARGDVAALAAEYAGWADEVAETIEALDETYCWGIFDRAPLARWSQGRIALLGDAAHAMVPHFGQGANQAIEDAFTLGVLLQSAKANEIADRLCTYEQIRKERTSRIQIAARDAGRLYRNAELDQEIRRVRIGELLAGFQQWVYPHDAETVAAQFLGHSLVHGRNI